MTLVEDRRNTPQLIHYPFKPRPRRRKKTEGKGRRAPTLEKTKGHDLNRSERKDHEKGWKLAEQKQLQTSYQRKEKEEENKTPTKKLKGAGGACGVLFVLGGGFSLRRRLASGSPRAGKKARKLARVEIAE